MNLGFVGLGKLGLPVAVALGQKHHVVGYDALPDLCRKRPYEHRELGPTKEDDFQGYFDRTDLEFVDSPQQVAEAADLIFIAVQTPHDPFYEGTTRLPTSRADFNYVYLVRAVRELTQYTRPEQIVVVISTVLPGTMRREVLPAMNGRARLVYNPFFVAMGQVMSDFLHPEFVLLGSDDSDALTQVKAFYEPLLTTYTLRDYYDPESEEYCPPFCEMSVESAELTKVAYNTYLSMKVTVANALMEICHRIPGCNVDDVTGALKLATDRIVSPKYMDGGMGDGGPCHPRDNIAMSWLARRLSLSCDLFGDLMRARERQTEWLATLIDQTARRYNFSGYPVVLLGKSYKPESNLTAGSPALLLANILRERGVSFLHYDPHVDQSDHPLAKSPPQAVFFVATKHPCFREYPFPAGSVVLDPFRYVPDREGVTVIPVGVGK